MKLSNYSLLIYFYLISVAAFPQLIQSPSSFLGYSLGEKFSTQKDLEHYCNYLIQIKPNEFRRLDYGKTPEGRPLFLIFRSSQNNLNNLEAIRINHLRQNALSAGQGLSEENLIVWLGFNIHGDEAAGTESALALLYDLAMRKDFKNQIIIIDPNQNPDGRARYTNWFASVHETHTAFSHSAAELQQQWPKGRLNHYLNDLNRDWAWQNQAESKQRMKVYHDWMPHVLADFHEMEANKSYFFPPSADPLHEAVEEWQKKSIDKIAEELKTLFTKHKWDYFNKKEFDLLYPSYADSYTTFNGGIGLTFEQGGSDEAGLLYIRPNGDTLRLSDRIEKHLETAKTLLSAIDNLAKEIIENYRAYHLQALHAGNGPYQSFLIKNNNPAKIYQLCNWLDQLKIEYHFTQKEQIVEGLYFSDKKIAEVLIQKNDLLISTKQAKGHLVRVLFEPKTKMDDIKTYDITAWSIPYIYHLDAIAFSQHIDIENLNPESDIILPPTKRIESDLQAISIPWTTDLSAKWLAKALELKAPIFIPNLQETQLYLQNSKHFNSFDLLLDFADSLRLNWRPIDKKEWRQAISPDQRPLAQPRIALMIGNETREYAVGDMTYFLDKEIGTPFTKVWASQFWRLDLDNFDILIFCDGHYKNISLNEEKLKKWIAKGGRLILLEGGLDLTSMLKIGQLSNKNLGNIWHSKTQNKPENVIQGAILKVKMHPKSMLSKGLSDGAHLILDAIPRYSVQKSNSSYMSSLNKYSVLNGYVGLNALNYLDDSFILGTYYFGKGTIYQFAVNPLFRGILKDGNLLMSNALFVPLR